MAPNISQAKRYREIVRSDLKLLRYPIPPNFDSDIALRTFLENLYNEAKERLSSLLNEGTPESTIRIEKSVLFIIAAGLFTFRRLDVAEDILTGIPGGRGSIRQLAWVLNVLLPMPKDMDALTNPDVVLEWLQVNISRLRWDESSEKYILES